MRPTQTLNRLFIITGDPSADYHAAHVVKALKHAKPDIEVGAVGNVHLQEAGATLFHDQAGMGRVGFGAWLGTPYHYFLGLRILKHLETFQPDAVLLIDYGGFNLFMAKQLKAQGYRVYYFIAPQVWASRPHRLKKIKTSVDRVFCIFPFEEKLYQAHDIPVTFVGHPLVSQLPPPLDEAAKLAFINKHGLDPNKKIIGLFPGSRVMEINYLLEPILDSLPLIQKTNPDTQFVLAKAPHLQQEFFQKKFQSARHQNTPPITVIEHQNHAIMAASDAVMLASGTVTLEAALYGTPMVISYKGHPLAYDLASRVCRLPYLGLPNILSCIPNMNYPMENIAPPVVPELLQYEATPEKLAAAFIPLLNPNAPETQLQQAAFTKITEKLGQIGTTNHPTAQRVAEQLLTMS